MKISYYDLLGLIKEKKEPKEIEVELIAKKSVKYVADYDSANDSFVCYFIKNGQDVDENYKYYLSDCLLESDMFSAGITIVDGNKKIKKIELDSLDLDDCLQQQIKTVQRNNVLLKNKVNEIIDKLNKQKKRK